MNTGGGEQEQRLEAERGRVLVEESREVVIVLDEADRVVAASRRARESIDGLVEGEPVPGEVLGRDGTGAPLEIPYDVGGKRERLVYVRDPGGFAAYEELRAGFTAAVSHELRTPLARLLALLETALLPGEDAARFVEQARVEVEQVRELIDDVLFLSELETGREVVSLGSTRVLPVLDAVAAELAERAARAGVAVRVNGDDAVEVAVRPRMLHVVAQNLAENAIRYAGPEATLTLTVDRDEAHVVVVASDDGVGVADHDLPRLFERFYRADRARASRGTGLVLAIVKHVVTSAGGSVEATRGPNGGLTITCRFPAP